MTLESNQYLIRPYYAAIDHIGMIAGWPFLSDKFTAHVVGFPQAMDRLAYQKFGEAFYQSLSGFQHNIEEMVADGERVIVRITASGRHTRAFHGIRPTGARISVAMSVTFRIKDGKIEVVGQIFDQFGMLQQMGAFPKAEDVLVKPVEQA